LDIIDDGVLGGIVVQHQGQGSGFAVGGKQILVKQPNRGDDLSQSCQVQAA
jgi:hypothetical protein